MNNIKIAGVISFLFIILNIIWPTGHDIMVMTILISYLLLIGFCEIIYAIEKVNKSE